MLSSFGADLLLTWLLVVQLLSQVQLFATPWTVARQASLSFTIAQSLLKLMSIELAMPSNHLVLCRPLLLLPPAFSLSCSLVSNSVTPWITAHQASWSAGLF